MLKVLPESRPRRARRLGGTIASLAAHAALVAGAVGLTMGPAGAAPAPPEPPRDTTIFIVPVARTAHRAPAGPRTTQTPQPTAPLPTHTIGPVVPPTLPPIDLEGPVVPPEHVDIASGAGVPTTGTVDGPVGVRPGDRVIGEREADRIPRLLEGGPALQYPEGLRNAGISGRVVLQLVVDTLGRAEPGSERVMEAAHPAFADAVRRALPRFRFAVGESAGRKVRTRVQIPFDFHLAEAGR